MYKIILAIRYLLKRRISYFSLFAVALCVFVVLIVITVLSGLTRDFKNKMHQWTGDCVVSSSSLVGFAHYEEFIEQLQREETIDAISPVIRNYTILKVASSGYENAETSQKPLRIMGINPRLHDSITGFSQSLQYNRVVSIANIFQYTYDVNQPGCISGIGIMFDRDSNGNYMMPEYLKHIKLELNCFPLTEKGTLALAGTSLVRSKTFELVDVSQSGISADWETIYIPFQQAQVLCGMAEPNEPKRVNAIFIKFKDGVEINHGVTRVASLWKDFVEEKSAVPLANLFGNVTVQNWKGYNRVMVGVAETQEGLMIIVFAMIGIITVFVVFVVFYMIVSHKSKDIGILKSIGVSESGLMGLFLLFGVLIGLAGSIIGAIAGWQFLIRINSIEDWLYEKWEFQLWDRSMYAIGDIPNTIDFNVLTVIILSAIAACLIGAFIPSRQAAKLEPVETLRVSKL
jgi:lipoprotein-releasing system permease protein